MTAEHHDRARGGYQRQQQAATNAEVIWLVPQQAAFARSMMQRTEDLLRSGKMR
jgi:hypothetical protein